MRKIAVMSVLAALIIGCGENSSITDAEVNYNPEDIFSGRSVNVNYQDYSVKAVDDNILNAKVSAPECQSYKELGNGDYLLLNCVAKPSFITIEGGKIANSDINQTFPLILDTSEVDIEDNFVVTPLTTLLVDANESEVDAILSKLGVDKDEVFKNPTNTKLLQKINAIYLKADADGVVSKKIEFIKTLRDTLLKDVNVTNGDFNVTEVAKKVELKSQQNPALFGLVFIGDLKDSDNILDEIKSLQNPTNITFLGLVFDKSIPDANITIKRGDNDLVLGEVEADSYGKWNWEINDSIKSMIENDDFVVIFEAKKDKTKLVSSISSLKLRELIKKYKRVTPNKTPDFVISNVTTAESAILDKRGAFDTTSSSYESNKTNIKTYYTDKILTTAAVIKDVVDNNNTNLISDYNDTFEFVSSNIVNANEVNLSTNITEANTTEPISDLEENITNNAILSMQINYVPAATSNNFESAAKLANNIFYRILAYYDNGKFIREYEKIETYPGEYVIKRCYLEDNSTSDWQCNLPVTIKNANFSDGDYIALNGDSGVEYSLDNNTSLFVSEVCKSYNIYEVTKSYLYKLDVNKSEPEVLVDSFDVVDMFRRMPKDDESSFKDLQNLVKDKTRDEVNIELNRFIREQLNNIQDYFSDEDNQAQCN